MAGTNETASAAGTTSTGGTSGAGGTTATGGTTGAGGSGGAASSVHVVGNQIYDGATVIRLMGVNGPGTNTPA